MKTVMLWPDVQREDGHWLPAVSLAKSLKDAGYLVKAMGIPDTASIVSPYKIPFTEVLSQQFPLGFARERLETGRTDLAYLLAIARGDLSNVFTGAGKPDLLVAGFFAALEALMVHYKYQLPLVLLTTFLRHPDSSPALFAKTTLLGLPPAVASKLIGLSTGNAAMSIDEFVTPLDSTPELIPMPKDFDFTDSDWKHPRRVTYVEPMVTRVPLDGTTIPPQEVPYFRPLPPTGKVLYGACGSQVEVFELSARQFYASLIDMMNAPGLKDRHLVLSVGTTLYQEYLKTYTDKGGGGTRRLPDNVSIAPWVPQLDILARTEAVFLHGGLASIKESIWSGVPMVVVPMVNDQFENALRIERLDLGVLTEVSRLSPQSLREALTQVTSSPWFGRSTARMRQIFLDAESRSPKRSIEVIQGVVAP